MALQANAPSANRDIRALSVAIPVSRTTPYWSKVDIFKRVVQAILQRMKIYVHIALFGVQFLMHMGAWLAATAQSSNMLAIEPRTALTAEQVVNNLIGRNLARAQGLSAYQGTRIYRLEYQGFPGSKSAEMVVDVRYQSPGTKEFTIRSEAGSKLLIERVFKKLLQSEKEALTEENARRTTLNRDNYKFAQIGYESTPTGALYVLSVEPRTKNKFLYRGRIWVDAEDFAVVRLQGEPAKNPSFWTKDTKIEEIYAKVSDFWFPTSNRSTTSIRLGGRAYLTIEYKDYQTTAVPPLNDFNSTVAAYP
jgi:hypothetical protein